MVGTGGRLVGNAERGRARFRICSPIPLGSSIAWRRELCFRPRTDDTGFFSWQSLAGCWGAALPRKRRQQEHLERGDEYFAQEQYREAVLEYRNVLEIDSDNAHAIAQLGLAHFELGELGQAFSYLVKAQELDPENLEVRLKHGIIYLLGGRTEEPKEAATFVLSKDPDNLDALVLLADSTTTPAEADALMARFEGVRAEHGNRAPYHLAIGSLFLKNGDVESAEQSFQRASEVEPDSLDAHYALGRFYLAKRELEQAEEEFKQARELADVGSPERMRLAEFYQLVGRHDEERQALVAITEEAADFLPAWTRLAELELKEGNYGEGEAAIAEVLKNNRLHPIGLLLEARLQTLRGQNDQAIQTLQTLLASQPQFVAARHQLAMAHVQAGQCPAGQVGIERSERGSAKLPGWDFAPSSVEPAGGCRRNGHRRFGGFRFSPAKGGGSLRAARGGLPRGKGSL